MKAERALAWYGRILLERHQHFTLAIVDRGGLPQLGRVAYRREGDDLYAVIEASSPIAQGLDALGPVAALLSGDDGLPLASITGAAELVTDPETIARLRASDPPISGDVADYRILIDALVPLQGAMVAGTFADGAPIVRQGEIADRFYVILQGGGVVSRATGGAPQEVARLQAGDFFGESGLLAGAPRNASVHAQGEVLAVSLSRNAFSTALHHGTPTAAELARAIHAAAQE